MRSCCKIQLFLSIVIVTLFGIKSFGQGPITDNNILSTKKPVFSSPTATAMEKFAEFPIADYTGVPNISIPLYVLKSKKVNVPISLSYHASGIKVDDIATNIGSGWALSVGGAINIMANGLVDEISHYSPLDTALLNKVKAQNFQSNYSGGYLDCYSALTFQDPISGSDPYYLYSGTNVGILRDAAEGTGDTEPDFYFYNFCGRAGKFFEDENGIFRTVPYSEMKIERLIVSSSPAGYKFTDENGNIFEFKDKETSSEGVVNSGSPVSATRFSRSYYLSKITTTDGESITFYYSSHSLSYDLQTIHSRSKTSTQSSCYELNQTGDYFSLTSTSTSMIAEELRIDSVKSWDGSLIKFLYSSSDRTDLSGSKSLDTVQLWRFNPDRVKLKEFLLGHSYATGRLTLTSVKEDSKPATQLTYNATSLPTRLSFSQDHYGYYNQRSNTTLLPIDEYMEFSSGADRSIDSNYTQAGILKKILHPTGGTTEFFYEPNDYFVTDTLLMHSKVIAINKASFPNMTVSDTFVSSPFLVQFKSIIYYPFLLRLRAGRSGAKA